MSVIGMTKDGIVWPIEIDGAEFLMGLLIPYAREHPKDQGVRQLVTELSEAVRDWREIFEDDEDL